MQTQMQGENSFNVKQYGRIKCILGGICGKYKVGPQQIQGLKYSGCSAALPIELVMVVSCFGGLAITLPPPISSPTLFSEVSGHGGLTNTDANTDRNTSTNTERNTPNSVVGSLVDIQLTTSSRRLDGGAYCGAPVGGKCMVSKAKLVLYAFAV